ncbi:hypothetical protein Gpo141_00010878 [Globisporangium polare]
MYATQTLALVIGLFAASADAHSKMILPAPTWDPAWGTNSPSGTIDGPNTLTVPTGMSFSTDPASNTKAFTTAFKAQTKYTSLLNLVQTTQVLASDASKECGFSLANGTAQPLPAEVEWDQLPSSHEGPCEVWCDDVLAFSDENCAINYPDSPAKFPYDKTKCTGAKMLTSVWLALHVPIWQAYLNCAPLSGATAAATSSGSSDTATSTATAAATSSASTAAEASTTSASYSDGSDEISYADASEESSSSTVTSTSTPTPTSTTAADSTSSSSSSTPAPTSTKTKCKAKTSRRRN